MGSCLWWARLFNPARFFGSSDPRAPVAEKSAMLDMNAHCVMGHMASRPVQGGGPESSSRKLEVVLEGLKVERGPSP